MASTVRISTAAKARLERIRRRWSTALGDTPTQQELLDAILAYGERHLDDMLAAAEKAPWPEGSWERFIASIPENGFEADSSTVDEFLYGGG